MQTEEGDGKANEKDETHFDVDYGHDIHNGETFDAGYEYGHYADYNDHGYVDDGGGGGAYNDYDGVDY